MRRLAIGVLVLLWACKGDSPSRDKAPVEPIEIETPAPEAERPTPLTWVVNGPNGSTYLHGTMHLGVDVQRDVHPIVFERLDASKTFVMETDITGIDGAAMMNVTKLPAGRTLDDELTAEQWKRLVAIAPLPADALAQFRPWFVLVAITQSLLPPTAPMDGVLQQRARDAGLELAYLEDWMYQVELLDEVVGTADLVDIIDNFDDTRQELADLANGYIAGDPDAIAKIMYDPEKYEKNPKVLDVLIVRRNKEWIPKLEKHIAKGNAFIAVGAGHLVGDRGVVAMLRERGHEVKRITVPAPARAQERPAQPAAAAP